MQFAIYADGLRVETAADVFLPDDAKLSPENRAELGRLGFNAPTVEAERAAGWYDTDEGSVNWFRDYPKPPDFAVDDLFEAFVGVARHRWFEGETEAATGLLERCSVICTDAGQPVIAARANLVGAELLAGSDPAASLATMRDARAVFDEHGAEHDRAGADLDLGNALFDLRRFDEAVQAYQDALTVFDLTDPDSAAAVRPLPCRSRERAAAAFQLKRGAGRPGPPAPPGHRRRRRVAAA